MSIHPGDTQSSSPHKSGVGFMTFMCRGRSRARQLIEPIRELAHHFLSKLRQVDWSDYQLAPILVASLLINILELAVPLYVNIVYTSVLPSGALSSLVVLTLGVVGILVLVGLLKVARLSLTGADGARVEHRRRMQALVHFSQLRLSDYLSVSPAIHAERINSINMLRDESSLQALTTAIDLAFTLVFVIVLFALAGSVGIVALVAIAIYLIRSLYFARHYEVLSRRRDLLELECLTYQGKLLGSIELIKSNGLGRQLLVGNEQRHERLAWQRMLNNRFVGEQQAFGSLMSQLTTASVLTWGALLVIQGRLMIGALAAALLLAGKIIAPWQQAMALWNSYRRLGHARDEFQVLLELPTESEGGQAELDLQASGKLSLTMAGASLAVIPSGSVALLRDGRFGADTRQLLLALLQIEPSSDLLVNGVPIGSYHRDQLRVKLAYVDPSRDFFEGSLLENITSFQPLRFQRRALFWSFLTRLDAKVRSLPAGYNTSMGSTVPPGLSRDTQQLFHVITALARSPEVLLLDLSDCAYGKEFIDGLERVLNRCRGSTTVLISGTGRVLQSLCDQEVLIPELSSEVLV
jgi:ATP-binding cassette, subfamily C, bacterial LapB